jgi:hypothetical protein
MSLGGKLFLVILLLVFQVSAYVPNEGNVTATLGTFFYKNNFADTVYGAHSQNLSGLGLIVLGDLNTIGSLEIAIFDLYKQYYREQAGYELVEEKEVVHITMGYRYWINPYFSSSLSFYSSYSMGDAKIVHSTFVPGTEIDTSARDTAEYGFDFAIQGDLYSRELWAITAEARYSFSVTSKENEKSDHYGLMLGFRHLMQEKRVDGDVKKN